MKGKVKGVVAVQQWLALAEESLQAHGPHLNSLNVFPVADSDTGANMLATIRACRGAVEALSTDDLGELLAEAGAVAMERACGNSGTLLAVVVSGMAEPLAGRSRLTIDGLAAGLDRASLRAWSALTSPVDGTMLSVLDAVRDQARSDAVDAEEPESRAALEQAVPGLIATGYEALLETQHQLAELTQARVVDAGGLGLLLVLDALRATIRGEELDEQLTEGLAGAGGSQSRKPQVASDNGERDAAETASLAERAELTGTVELMCTAQLDPLGAALLRHQLDELGDSVIISPIRSVDNADEELYHWRIHVHTEDPSAVRSAVESAGRLETSTVTPLVGQGSAD